MTLVIIINKFVLSILIWSKVISLSDLFFTENDYYVLIELKNDIISDNIIRLHMFKHLKPWMK